MDFNSDEYKKWASDLMNNEDYLRANEPQLYFSKMLNGDFYTDEEREIIKKRRERDSVSNEETSKFQIMGD